MELLLLRLLELGKLFRGQQPRKVEVEILAHLLLHAINKARELCQSQLMVRCEFLALGPVSRAFGLPIDIGDLLGGIEHCIGSLSLSALIRLVCRQVLFQLSLVHILGVDNGAGTIVRCCSDCSGSNLLRWLQ